MAIPHPADRSPTLDVSSGFRTLQTLSRAARATSKYLRIRLNDDLAKMVNSDEATQKRVKQNDLVGRTSDADVLHCRLRTARGHDQHCQSTAVMINLYVPMHARGR